MVEKKTKKTKKTTTEVGEDKPTVASNVAAPPAGDADKPARAPRTTGRGFRETILNVNGQRVLKQIPITN